MSFGRDLQPLIILGAARSGTKLLRELFDMSPACTVIPYPLNNLWRSGLESDHSDRRPASHVTPSIKDKIRSRLLKFADKRKRSKRTFLVEKTCANTLRVPFIKEVLPEARFVHIIRDGRDVAVSAREKWIEGPSVDDLLRKIRTFSFSDISSFIWEIRNWARKRSGATIWGPRYENIEQDLRTHSRLEVCALQWRACVQTCLTDLAEVSSDQITTVHYEDLVSNRTVLERILERLDVLDKRSILKCYDMTVHEKSVGRWRRELTADVQKTLDNMLAPTIERINSRHTASC